MKKMPIGGILALIAVSPYYVVAAAFFTLAFRDEPERENKPQPPAATLRDYAPTADCVERPYGLLSFDARTRSPRWVLEHLTPQSLAENVTRGNHAFHPDPAIAKPWRVSPADYEGSRLDRGHLACAANHRAAQEEFDATFSMSNMMPQVPEVNEQVWSHLESAVRTIAEGATNTWVITAPAYLPSGGKVSVTVLSAKAIWKPTHCGKAVLVERQGRYEALAWLAPNAPNMSKQYDTYRVPTDEWEEKVGLDVWAWLPDEIEDRIEAKR
ncbi:MAG: DNA/RNA non-specific endonuclease [Acidiferrobacteraceae bacterium]